MMQTKDQGPRTKDEHRGQRSAARGVHETNAYNRSKGRAILTVEHAHRADPHVVNGEGHVRFCTLGLHHKPASGIGQRVSQPL